MKLVDIDPKTLCIDPERGRAGDRAEDAGDPARPLRRPGRRHGGDHRRSHAATTWASSRTRRMPCRRPAAAGSSARSIPTRPSSASTPTRRSRRARAAWSSRAIAKLARRMKTMRLHGMSRDAFDRFTAKVPSWYYEIVAPGFKYNLTDIAAAIGIHQLKRAGEFQRKREAIAARFAAGLATFPSSCRRRRRPAETHAWHLYVLRLARGRADRARCHHRSALRRGHRLQRALHPAASATVLARSLCARRSVVPALAARLRAHAQPSDLPADE